MDRAILKSFAKVNLWLTVTSKRDDGFHNIKSVFQSISLYDKVTIKKAKSAITIVCSDLHIPNDKSNTCFKAAQVFLEKTGINEGVEISIQKIIPTQAGLGGGSSNGAAVLVGLNKIFGTGFTDEVLCDMAIIVGSDVPFFIRGGRALVEGKGDIIKTLPPSKKEYMVLVKPQINILTKWAYERIDLFKVRTEAESKFIVGKTFYNIFESVVFPVYPEIKEIKERLIKLGARSALMSGSGSSVFAVAKSESEADNILRIIKDDYPFVSKVNTVDKGVEIVEEVEIGKVAHYFSKAMVAAIKITGELKVGDTIHIKGHKSDFTQKVDSIQMEHKQLDVARPGDDIGIKVGENVRDHDVVYKVIG